VTIPMTFTPQTIVVAETKDLVYSRLRKELQGIRSQLVRVNTYSDLRDVLSQDSVEWLLCDSQFRDKDRAVWELVQSEYPETSLLVYFTSESKKVAEELYEAGVFAVDVDRLLDPDFSIVFYMLSMLHESDVRLRQLRRNFRDKERLTRLGELTRGIFHDLNNRLTGMIGFLEMTKMRNPQLTDLDGVIAQCKQMDSMFSNVLRIARQERVRDIRQLNLNTLIREELKLLEGDPLYRDFVLKEFEFDDSLPVVHGVYSDFSLSFLNIAKNAIESMHPVEERVLKVSTSHDNDWIKVSVEDTGTGIEARDIPKIFRPFFTTKPIETKEGIPVGTGLGLANAKELLEKYRTEWVVDSTVGVGTKVEIRIPTQSSMLNVADFK
jgi:signal transduction histidine kinase